MFHPSPDAFRIAQPALPAALLHLATPAQARGFAGSTLVEGLGGWLPVADVCPGMHLATLDGGFAEVTGCRKLAAAPFDRPATVRVPGGALGNCDDLILGAAQDVVLPTGPAETVLQAAFARVPAASLVGHFGITGDVAQAGGKADSLFAIDFAAEEVLWANSGILLHAPASGAAQAFLRLDDARARALIGLLEDGTPFPTLGSAAARVAA